MTPRQAHREIRALALANRVYFTNHAVDRMQDRNVTEEEVFRVLLSPTSCSAADEGRWRLAGKDRDGDGLAVIVRITRQAIVVTVTGD